MDAEVASACSGKHQSERGGERHLRWPATKTMKMASMQGLRRGAAGWRGRGRHGDARGHVGEARGARRPRLRRTAATSSARLRERERERRGREREERSRGSRVLCGVVLGVEAAAGRKRSPKTHTRAPRFPSAYWQEEEDGSALGGLGRYSARTGRPAQVTLSLFSNLNCFCFLFILFCFDLVKY